MALSRSLSLSAPPARLLRIAGTDMFENRFSATLSNLVIIYTNCFGRNRSILNRHSCHYEENGVVLGAMWALSDLDGPRWGFALSNLLELHSEVEDLLFHATTSTPFLCVSLLSLSPNTIQSVMRLYPKERSMHLLAGEWEEQLWTQTTAWELQCRCLST